MVFKYKAPNPIREWQGRYFDGETPVPIEVTVIATEDSLSLFTKSDGLLIRQIKFTDLTLVHTKANGQRVDFSVCNEIAARLSIEGKGVSYQLKNFFPQARGSLPGMGKKSTLMVSLFLIVFLLSFGLFIWKISGFIPSLLPTNYVIAMGDSTLDIIHSAYGSTCKNADAEKVLDKMVNRIRGDRKFKYPLHVEVVNSEIVNALAAPGAKIVIFNGLLTQADSAEEVAGVLGHEMGHVLKQHSLTRLAQTMGLDLMVALLGGSNLGGISQQILLMSYSRDAENEADEMSIMLLNEASISTNGAADFFDKLSQNNPSSNEDSLDIPLFLSTHPASDQRANLYRSVSTAHQPVLTEEEWEVLLKICENDPKQNEQ